jgi:hypothetical protein
MTRKSYAWLAKIKQETLGSLQDLALDLGFRNTTGGPYAASPPELLDALAAAYERDPEAVTAALRALGVTNTKAGNS